MKTLVLSLLLICSTAQARWAKPSEQGAVLESYTIKIKVKSDGSFEQVNEQLWRAQSEEGKISLALREIEYNSFSDQVEILEAKTINGDKVFPVPPSAIEDRDKGESRDYDALKVKSLAFPQVQVGSKIYFRYRTKVSPAILKDRWSMNFEIQPEVLMEKILLEVESERPLFLDASKAGDFFDIQSTPKKVTARSRRPTHGQAVGEKNIYFSPQRFTRLVLTTDPDWRSFFEQISQEFEGALKGTLPKDLRSWVKVNSKEPEGQLTETLERMSQHFRYFGDWRRVRGGLVPRSLVEIETSRYGDCKDLSLLLTRLLREQGFKAQVALVRRGPNPWVDEPTAKLPYMGAFNHAIVRAEKDGKVWWLDPTNAVASTRPASDIAGRMSWVLGAEPHLDRIPAVRPEDYIYEDEATFHFQKEGGVKVDVISRHKKSAAAQLAYFLLTNPEEKVRFDLLDFYSEGNEIQSSHFIRSPKASRRLGDLEFSLSYQTQAVTYRTPAGLFFPLKETVLAGAFFETRDRVSDLFRADVPYIHTSRRIFKNVKMESEFKDCVIQSPWADIQRSIRTVEKDVQVEVKTTLYRPVILQTEYNLPAFLKLQKEVRECFYRVGLVFETR